MGHIWWFMLVACVLYLSSQGKDGMLVSAMSLILMRLVWALPVPDPRPPRATYVRPVPQRVRVPPRTFRPYTVKPLPQLLPPLEEQRRRAQARAGRVAAARLTAKMRARETPVVYVPLRTRPSRLIRPVRPRPAPSSDSWTTTTSEGSSYATGHRRSWSRSEDTSTKYHRRANASHDLPSASPAPSPDAAQPDGPGSASVVPPPAAPNADPIAEPKPMPDVALPREAHDGDHERSDNTGRPEIPRRKSKDSTTLFPEPSASVSATRQHNVPATSNVLAPCVAPASVSQVFEPPAPSPGPSLLSRMQPAERGQTPPPEQGPSLLSRIQPLGSSSTVTSSLLDVDMLSVSDSSSDSSSMPSWSPLPSLAQLPASVKVTDWLPRARLPMWVPEDIVMDEVEDALYQSSSSDSLSDDDVVMTDEPVKLVVAFEPVPAQMELDSPRPMPRPAPAPARPYTSAEKGKGKEVARRDPDPEPVAVAAQTPSGTNRPRRSEYNIDVTAPVPAPIASTSKYVWPAPSASTEVEPPAPPARPSTPGQVSPPPSPARIPSRPSSPAPPPTPPSPIPSSPNSLFDGPDDEDGGVESGPTPTPELSASAPLESPPEDPEPSSSDDAFVLGPTTVSELLYWKNEIEKDTAEGNAEKLAESERMFALTLKHLSD